MQNILQLQELIDKELARLKYPSHPENLYRPIQYSLNLRAKRIRPTLLLISYQLFNKNIEKAILPALGIEFFHNFTLLHDDIMDNFGLRRGAETVHKKWNSNIAILSADTMLVKAYKFLSQTDNIKDVLKVFNETAIKVCEGQQLDMDFENKSEVSISDYLKMTEYKTAVLLAASLKIGAIIGEAKAVEADHLYEFGRNIGIAFQLQDDLLDVYGNVDDFGKQIGADIMANKKTYLYLKAVELASLNQKKILVKYFSKKQFNYEKKVNQIKIIFDDLDIKKHTQELIEEYYCQAMNELKMIKISNITSLEEFANLLFKRSN